MKLCKNEAFDHKDELPEFRFPTKSLRINEPDVIGAELVEEEDELKHLALASRHQETCEF